MKNEYIHHGFRHSGEIISHAVCLYFRSTLSFRDVEEILAYRGIDVSYSSIRHCVTVSDKAIPRKSEQSKAKREMSGI